MSNIQLQKFNCPNSVKGYRTLNSCVTLSGNVIFMYIEVCLTNTFIPPYSLKDGIINLYHHTL